MMRLHFFGFGNKSCFKEKLGLLSSLELTFTSQTFKYLNVVTKGSPEFPDSFKQKLFSR